MQTNLWDKIRNGDSSAMKSLYQTCYQELYAYGFKMVADKEQTKDAIHELFCEFWEKHARLPIVLQVLPYIKVCLRNKLLKQIKLHADIFPLTETFESDTAVEQSYEALLIISQQSELQKQQLAVGLSRLTKMQREVVKLRFYDGYSYEEIAQMLDLKLRTVYNHVHVALNNLRDYFEE